MAEELQNTEMLRSDFINNFSHEFKTPIVSIAGFAGLLAHADLPEEQKKQYLRSIEEESRRLSLMATNVLQLTKIENQTILANVSCFNLSEQIRSAVLLLENKWEKKEIEMVLDFEEHMIRADEELLKEVWINLLDNAVKFTPQGGTVSLDITETEEAYSVAIGNTGEEIPKEKEEKIYTGSYEEKINAFYEEHKDTAAGAMVGVFDKDGVLFKGYYGYSDIANGTKVDENTVIDWGSSTKTMVWVSVMQLWEQGKIDLEKDIREYLPDGFLTNLKYDKPVRMIDLMNHRAGFQEYYVDMFLPANMNAYTLEEALKLEQPAQIFEPDTITAYSNWGVALAGYIVERVSGESFADYVHHHIFV